MLSINESGKLVASSLQPKPESKAAVKRREIKESFQRLKKLLKPGNTVHCVLRHVSKSGMQRRIDFYVMKGNEPWYITYDIGKVCDYRQHHDGGLVVGGAGMDMGFSVVYNLGRTLFPKGFKLAKGQYGRNGDKSGFDDDGGYALKHSWL